VTAGSDAVVSQMKPTVAKNVEVEITVMINMVGNNSKQFRPAIKRIMVAHKQVSSCNHVIVIIAGIKTT